MFYRVQAELPPGWGIQGMQTEYQVVGTWKSGSFRMTSGTADTGGIVSSYFPVV
jgi:hypothetical protein